MKKVNFIIGNSNNELINNYNTSFCLIKASDFYKKYISKKKYIGSIVLEIVKRLENNQEVFIEAYNMQGNDYYMIINSIIGNICFDLQINANVYLGKGLSVHKTSFPTIMDGFNNVSVISEGKELLNKLFVSPFQGYNLYYKGMLNGKKSIINESNGYGDYNNLNAINDRSRFRLASVSKQFIAYGILELIDNKKLTFNTKLYDLFNDLPQYTKKITIKMLLQHTSGLPDYETIEEYDGQLSDYDVLDFVRESKEPLFTPGEKYKYSNTGYVILGIIIEKVSYTKLGIYMEENVFEKSNMFNTIVNYQNETIIKNRVYGYKILDDKMIKCDQSFTSATIGDGGIYSNIVDLKKWIKYLRNNKEVLKKMTEDLVATDENGNYYGYGLRVKKINFNDQIIELVYHCGSTIGTNTLIGFIDSLDIEFIFLTNQNGLNTGVLIDEIIEINFKKNL